ncbi:MAG: DUF2442 domain-containing protein [Bacteroidaceae bacterium]|nr:DUF2442 domain-containing protein [Bacteroidaceae bacterium]
MWKEILSATYLDGHRLNVLFTDGARRIMDFLPLIRKYPVYAPLDNVDTFKRFVITDTLEWNDGAIDIAPEYIYEHGTVAV